jgi:photosystem II stability/assembly factor-like uncharacterized protein
MALLNTGWVPVGPACGLRGQVGYDTYSEAIVGGRVTCIAFDSNVAGGVSERIYVGTTSGGVWGSTDNGATWVPMTDDRISLAIGSMCVDQATHKLYVAPGEAKDSANIYTGNGLLIYTPGTNSWDFRQEPSLSWVRSSAIVIEHRPVPANPNPFPKVLYVGTDKGLFRSNNEGVNWTQEVVDPANPAAPVSDIAYVYNATSQAAVMYVALYGKGVWKRTGHTGAFTNTALPVPNGTRRIRVAACAGNDQHVLVVGGSNSGALLLSYTSSTGGNVWNAIPAMQPAPKQTFHNLDVEIHPTTFNTMFFSEARVRRSIDHGQKWQVVSNPTEQMPGIHADQHAIAYDPKNSQHWWAGNDGGIWVSTDGGDNWRPRNRGLQNFLFYSFAHDPGTEAVAIAGAQDNGTLRFEGNAAWRLVSGGDGFYVGIDPVSKENWYASYCFIDGSGAICAIQGSDKYGQRDTFQYRVRGIVNPYPSGNQPFYVPFVIDPQAPATMYLGTNNLYVTQDRGKTGWQAIQVKKPDGTAVVFDTTLPAGAQPSSDTSITAICVHPELSGIVYVGTADGRLFRLEQVAGQPWNLFQGAFNPVPNACVSDIAVPPKKTPNASTVVYAAIGTKPATAISPASVAGGRFYFSDDFGDHLVPRHNPVANRRISVGGVNIEHTDNPVNAVCVNPHDPLDVFIGCDVGVFRSQDEGLNWNKFMDNLPNVPVYDLQFHKDTKILRAATFGRGVWERALDPTVAEVASDPGCVDLYMRDNALDAGRRKTSIEGPSSLDGGPATWKTGADIKVDSETWFSGFQKLTSTKNYQENGPADFIAFEALQHEKIRQELGSHVFVQVHNRGPAAANNVQFRAWCAEKEGDGYPDLPADFWQVFPAGVSADPASKWAPIHSTTIPTIRPGEPEVVQFTHAFPWADYVGILAAVASAEDPINIPNDPAFLKVQHAVQHNKRVILKEAEVGMTTGEIVFVALVVTGVVAGLVIGGVLLAKGSD